jgi:hypothetical protein
MSRRQANQIPAYQVQPLRDGWIPKWIAVTREFRAWHVFVTLDLPNEECRYNFDGYASHKHAKQAHIFPTEAEVMTFATGNGVSVINNAFGPSCRN